MRSALESILVVAALSMSVPVARAQFDVHASYPHPAAMSVVATAQGFDARNDHEDLTVTLCAPGVVHVVARPAGSSAAPLARPWMLANACPGASFMQEEQGALHTLKSSGVTVELNAQNASLRFRGADGHTLLEEQGNLPRTYDPSSAMGLHKVIARFRPDATEALYGLGQHQSGAFNYRGTTVELGQNNTDIAIPLLLSSKGYGILWNTASFGYVDNRFPLELNFEAEASDAVDYYLLYGPEMDQVLHAYRALTGHAPLLPRWAYGFIQSKDRYKAQAELLDVAAQYRARRIPMDGLVQDWFWWRKGGEGDPLFNEGYPDVPATLKTLHDEHVHTLISTWGMMDHGSASYQAMAQAGLEIPGTSVYDATSAAGRDFYWSHLPGKLFAEEWDGFWLDSAEPEEGWPHTGDAILRYKNLAIGSGLAYTNIFPFLHNLGVQEHWRAAGTDKRTLLLTRSSFLGQQRVGAMVWSGDVYASWWALRRQVPAGLNFALSGMPYWTTDIGGYHPLFDKQADTPEYEELYARWFEYGAFCPIFRTHGHRDHNEIWSYPRIAPALEAIDKLHYRLLPYIYAQAWRVTSEDATIQRPLVMDFRADERTHEIGDEFLYGPAMLVAPVVEEHATHRAVYLPKGAAWFDFWTGQRIDGGQQIEAEAPLARIPLYVRAGSILPMGPEIAYTGEASDPIELRIYPGADAHFTLYEDAGDGYGYEKGEHATIALDWNDATHTLRGSARAGSFAGMNAEHRFHVIVVRGGHGTGGAAARADKVVVYDGKAFAVRL